MRIHCQAHLTTPNRLKSHFTSLLSTISFTLYALLPTFQTHLSSAYPVEETSKALQGLSASSLSSSQGSVEGTPENSLFLHETVGSTSGVEHSWASEFQGGGSASMLDSLAPSAETDDAVSLGLEA